MKTLSTSLAAFALTILLFTQCRKNEPSSNTTYSAHFWTSMQSNDGELKLYIDNVYKGDLPYLAYKPDCSNNDLNQKLLSFPLPSGKHFIEAKDVHGNVKSSSNMKIETNSQSVSGGEGGMGSVSTGTCLVVEMFY